MERVDQGDPIIIDADTGEVHIRPSGDVIAAYTDKARFRAGGTANTGRCATSRR